jgi:hypothetical protein
VGAVKQPTKVPSELAPAVFLDAPARAAYFRAGARLHAQGVGRELTILAGLHAAAALTLAPLPEPAPTAPPTATPLTIPGL